LRKIRLSDIVFGLNSREIMATANVKTSPVNIDERKKIDIRTGDTVKVYQKIQEKGKTRLQMFEGLVLAKKHGKEAGATFTVRRVAGGYGVEKIFPLYSPLIDKIEITKRAKVRRAKLYHIREKAAKEISKRMKMEMMRKEVAVEGPEVIATESHPENKPE
jgi:large subunit ribosomal protein L19